MSNRPFRRRPAMLRLTLVALVTALAGLPLATPAHAALSTVGPVDPANGFPTQYGDANGVQLKPCFDPAFCVVATPNPGAPVSFPDNFGDEFFYFIADTAMTSADGGLAFYRAGIEGAFLNGGVAAGDQIVFARVRIRVDNLVPGASYTVTHPYGVETFIAEATPGGVRSINSTSDTGCFALNCDFTIAMTGPVGPFLQWDPAVGPVPPAGFLANFFVSHPVVGSPFGTNVFRIEGPNVGGLGVDMIQTDQFGLGGQLAPPLGTTASPPSVAFPAQKVGTGSAPQVVTVSNTTGAATTMGVASITGPAAADFVIGADSCSATTLADGASCQLGVTFTPTAALGRAATISIADGTPASPLLIPLSGTGNGPFLSVTPASVDFGKVKVVTGSARQTLQISNIGNEPMDIGDFTVAGTNADDFALEADGCSASTLAAGAGCAVDVAFHPSVTRLRTAELSLPTSVAATPLVMPLRGWGAAPIIKFEPDALRFGKQLPLTASNEKKVAVRNVGDAALDVDRASVAGGLPLAEFTISSDGCSGKSVAPGGLCFIGVKFAPILLGARTANLMVDSDALSTPRSSLPLSGTGALPV